MAGNAKYWSAVLYTENLRQDWIDAIDEVLQVPFAYAVHDKDRDGEGGLKKPHMHLLLAFSNTTTYNNVMTVVNGLSGPQRACNKVERVASVRYLYEYLIHNTEKAKEQGKFQYSPSERITGNGFNIADFSQISGAEKERMAEEIADVIFEQDITNFFVLRQFVRDTMPEEYMSALRSYSSYLERLTRGLFQLRSAVNEQNAVGLVQDPRSGSGAKPTGSH